MTIEQFKRHVIDLGFNYSDDEPISPDLLDIKAELLSKYSKLLVKSQPYSPDKMLFLIADKISLIIGFDVPEVGCCYFEWFEDDEHHIINNSHFCKTGDIFENCKTVFGH